jgi:hypothetical protein
VGFVEGETGYCSETCVMCDVDRSEEISIKLEEAVDIKEEVSIKVEDNIDIKDKIPQTVIFPPIKTKHEVRFLRGCKVGAAPPKPSLSSDRGTSTLAIPALTVSLGSLTIWRRNFLLNFSTPCI